MVLKPVTYENIGDFEDTAFEAMSPEEKRRMIGESLQKAHDGAYFELLAVCDGESIVGFMSLYAHSAHIIGIGPEIKKGLRRRGYGFRGETLALRYAGALGYTVAVAVVREENAASRALHEKLGFEAGAHCLGKKGNPVRVYVREI